VSGFVSNPSLQGTEPTAAVRRLMSDHRLLCLGEMHNAPGRVLSAELVAAAAQGGAKLLLVELDVSYQALIDRWLRSRCRDHLPVVAGGGLGPPTPSTRPYLEMLETARAHGLRIVAIDAARLTGERREEHLAHHAYGALSTSPNEKAVIVIGQLHLVPRPFGAIRRSMLQRLRQRLDGIVTVGRAVPLPDRPDWSRWAETASVREPMLVRTARSALAEWPSGNGPQALFGRDFDHVLFYPPVAAVRTHADARLLQANLEVAHAMQGVPRPARLALLATLQPDADLLASARLLSAHERGDNAALLRAARSVYAASPATRPGLERTVFDSRGQSRELLVGAFDDMPSGVKVQLPLLLKTANAGFYGNESIPALQEAFRNNDAIAVVRLNEAVEVPRGTVLPSWALVPSGTVLPQGTRLPAALQLSDGSVVTPAALQQQDVTLSAPVKLQQGTVLAEGLLLPAGTVAGAAAMTGKSGVSEATGELGTFYELERVIGNPALPNGGTQAAVALTRTAQQNGWSWWAMTNEPATFNGVYSDREGKVQPSWATSYDRFGEGYLNNLWFDKADPNSLPPSIEGRSIFTGMWPATTPGEYQAASQYPDLIDNVLPKAMIDYNEQRQQLGLSPATLASRIFFGGGPDRPTFVWEGDNARSMGSTRANAVDADGMPSGEPTRAGLTRTWGMSMRSVPLRLEPFDAAKLPRAPDPSSGNISFVNAGDPTFQMPSQPLRMSVTATVAAVNRAADSQLRTLDTLVLLEARSRIAAQTGTADAQRALQRLDAELRRRGIDPEPPPSARATPPQPPGDGGGPSALTGAVNSEPPQYQPWSDDSLNPQRWPIPNASTAAHWSTQSAALWTQLGKAAFTSAGQRYVVAPLKTGADERLIEPLRNTPLGSQVAAWSNRLNDGIEVAKQSAAGRKVLQLYDYTLGSDAAQAGLQRFRDASSQFVRTARAATAAMLVAGAPTGQTRTHVFTIGQDMNAEQTYIARLLGLPDGYHVQVTERDVPGTEGTGAKAMFFAAEAPAALFRPGLPGQRGTAQPGIAPATGKAGSPPQTLIFSSAGWLGPNAFYGFRLGSENLFVGATSYKSLGALTANLPLVRLGARPLVDNAGKLSMRGNTVSAELSAVPARVVSTQRFGLGPLQVMSARYSGPINEGLTFGNTHGAIATGSNWKPFYSTTAPFITGTTSFNPEAADVQAAEQALQDFFQRIDDAGR
jgi:hypothetical protein